MKILIWQRGHDGQLTKNFFIDLSKVCNWECRDRTDLGNLDYSSQQDLEFAIAKFRPDAVAICDTFRSSLPVNVPDDIYVFSYWDHTTYQFSLIGKEYFQNIHEKDYALLAYLDMDIIDTDRVLKDSSIKDHFLQFVFYPLPYLNKNDEDIDMVCESDVSIIKYYQEPIKYFTWFLKLQNGSVQEQTIQRMIGYILPKIKDRIEKSNGKILSFDWIDAIIKDAFDTFDFWRFGNDREKMFKRWRNFAIHNLFESAYTGCVFDWLVSADINLKIWGRGWESVPRYAPFLAGVAPERSEKLRQIYKKSKITVNQDAQISLHRRVFEAMQEKSMVIQMEVECPWDWSDWRRYFKEDESIIIARSKNELIQKIHYYIEHEDKRKYIADNAYRILEDNGFLNNGVLKHVGAKLEKIVQKK